MRVFCGAIPTRIRSHRLYFYELHEGDEEIFMDLLVVHEEQFEAEDFFELVQVVREKVQDTFEEDTLIEAIAAELEREHGFTFVSDGATERLGPRLRRSTRRTGSSRPTTRSLDSPEYRSMLRRLRPRRPSWTSG